MKGYTCNVCIFFKNDKKTVLGYCLFTQKQQNKHEKPCEHFQHRYIKPKKPLHGKVLNMPMVITELWDDVDGYPEYLEWDGYPSYLESDEFNE